ncbi:hypothetical protein [Planotetraspora sp. GP83]
MNRTRDRAPGASSSTRGIPPCYFQGYLNRAVESGQRAADEVIVALRR